MTGARRARLLHRLVNDQTLPGIMAQMPLGDWKKWAKERPQWIHENLEEVFWKFVDKKWRDSLNVVAVEPAFTDYSTDFNRNMADNLKKGELERAKKGQAAEVNTATAEVTEITLRAVARSSERAHEKCKFKEVIECTGLHLSWLCKAVGDKTPEERSRIIEDNKLCPFCLLHSAEEMCYLKTYKTKPVCSVPEWSSFTTCCSPYCTRSKQEWRV